MNGRTENRIKTAGGWQWLTVPVLYQFPQLIREVGINNREHWQKKQRQAIISNYRKAPYWSDLENFFEDLFTAVWEHIAPLNIHGVRRLVEILGIKTPIFTASELGQFPRTPMRG